MAEEVVMSAAMSLDELQKSINDTLQKIETRFMTFSDNVENSLNGLSGDAEGLGTRIGKGINTGLTAQLAEAERKINELKNSLASTTGKSTASSGGTAQTAEQTPVINVETLQQANDAAARLSQNFATANNNVKNINASLDKEVANSESTKNADSQTNQELSRRQMLLNQIREQRQSEIRLQQNLNDAQRKNTILSGGQDYESAMSLQTNSIQQRIDKIRALEIVQRNLNTTDANYQTNLQSTNKEIANLKKANTEAAAAGGVLEKGNNKLIESFKNLSRRVMFYFGLGAITGFVRELYVIRGQYEMLERSIGAILDNFQQGSQIFSQITANALKSPFTVLDLAGAAKQLIAYNFSADEVVGTTKRLADISSALGVPLERVVYNLGQIRAQTVLTARDARDFANAGLAIVPKLASMYTQLEGKVITTGDVFERMSKKMVSYQDVMKVITSLTDQGGMFFDFQAKQAETLKGQLSNLTDAFNDLGKSNQGLLSGGVQGLRVLFNNWKAINEIINDVIATIGLYKGAQLILNATIGKGNLALVEQADILRRQTVAKITEASLTRALTTEEQSYLATSNNVTVADYKNLLLKKNLTASQAMMLLSSQKNNVALKEAMVSMNILNAEQVKTATSAKTTTMAWQSFTAALKKGAMAVGNFLAQNALLIAATIAISVITRLITAHQQLMEQLDEINKKYNDWRTQLTKINSQEIIDVKKNNTEGIKKNLQDLVDFAKENFDKTYNINISVLNDKQAKEAFASIRLDIEALMSFSKTYATAFTETNIDKSFKKIGDEATTLYDNIINTTPQIITYFEKHAKALENIKNGEQALMTLETARGENETYISYINRMTAAYKTLGIEMTSTDIRAFGSENNAAKQLASNFGMDYNVFKTLTEGMKEYQRRLSYFAADYSDVIDELAKKMNLSNIPDDQKTVKLKFAIDQLSKDKGWSDLQKEIVYQETSKKLKINILLDPKKSATTNDLAAWQNTMQQWANSHGITFNLNFTQNESEVDFSKRMHQEVENTNAELELSINKYNRGIYSRVQTMQDGSTRIVMITKEEAKKTIADLQAELAARKQLEYASGYTDTKGINKQASQARKEEGQTIKQEIQLINDLNSSYDKLLKSGSTKADALKFVADEYDKSFSNINAILKKFKIAIKPEDFTGKNDTEIIKVLEQQMKAVKDRAMRQELDLEIKKLKVEAREYDLSAITDNLQTQLSNIKESYELGIEVKANPELANMFSNVLGVDFRTLPKTAEDAVKQLQKALDDMLNKYKGKTGTTIPSFNILETSPQKMDEIAKQYGLDKNGSLYKSMVNYHTQSIEWIKKEESETIKSWQELLNKYGDYATKKQQIQDEATKERLTLIGSAGTPQQKEQAASLELNISLAKTPEQKTNLIEQVKALSDEVAKGSDTTLKLNVAIDTSQKQKLANLQFDIFKSSSSYTKLFDNIGNVSTRSIENIISQLDALKQSMGEDLSPEDAKALMEAFSKMEDEMAKRNPFETIVKGIAEYIKSIKDLKNARAEEKKADEEVAAAQLEVESAQAALNDAQHNSNTSASTFLGLNDKLKTSTNKLTDAKKKQAKAEGDVAAASDEQKKAGKGISDGLTALQNGISTSIDILTDFKKALGISDASKMGKAIDSIVNSLGMMSAALSMVIVIAILAESSLWWVTLIAAALAGMLSVLQIIGGKKDTFTPLKNELENLKKVIDDTIDSDKELLKTLSGTEATDTYADMIKNIDLIIKSYRDLAKAAGKSGASWGSHSYAYKSNRALSGSFKEMSQIVGKTITSVQDLYGLSAEELQKIKEQMPTAWAKISSSIRESLEGIIEYSDKAKEAADALAEALTNISLDDLTNNFEKMLEDMDSSASDFANNMEEYLRNAIVHAMMAKTYSSMLEEWYKQFEAGMKDGTLSESEAAQLKKDYNDIVSSAMATRTSLLKAMGATTTSALSDLQKGIQGISESTGGAIEGYMNNISGQIFLQSTQLAQLLAQGDINTASNSQILLQLQQSYQMQSAIRTLISNAVSSNGRGFNVYMQN